MVCSVKHFFCLNPINFIPMILYINFIPIPIPAPIRGGPVDCIGGPLEIWEHADRFVTKLTLQVVRFLGI